MNNVKFKDLKGIITKIDENNDPVFAASFIFECLVCNTEFESPLYEDEQLASSLMTRIENGIYCEEMDCPKCTLKFSKN